MSDLASAAMAAGCPEAAAMAAAAAAHGGDSMQCDASNGEPDAANQ
jgi:hypothetical protein